MYIDFLLDVFQDNADGEAIVSSSGTCTYGWLRERTLYWQEVIRSELPKQGSVIALRGDFSPDAAAALLALTEEARIIVPVYSKTRSDVSRMYQIAEIEGEIEIESSRAESVRRFSRESGHALYQTLRQRRHPGLVLFSSGTSGDPKGAVHDLVGLLEKFKTRRPTRRTLSFLLFDHIGGLNTLLHTVSNAATMISVQDRSPDAVCEAIERHAVEVLPTSPTFLNLLLMSEAHERYDLRSLKLITYGTEPMPSSTLARLHATFPGVQLLQTYGLAELGILRSKSKSDDSLWVKVGGEGFETRVVAGILHIKAQSAMLGYLNAISPFTDDGWFVTGDAVEVDGEYIKVLGRKSEMINVGGQKVYPAEVESVIQELDNVAAATVYGQPHPIIGQIVCARVNLLQEEDQRAFSVRLKKHCASRLENYKAPVKVVVVTEKLYGERFKKARSEGLSVGG